MPGIKIAGIQMNCVVGEEERNLMKAFKMIDQAVLSGAKLICLPETFLTGYDLEYIKNKALPLTNEFIDRLRVKAREAKTYILAGIPIKTDKGVFNSSILFDVHGDIMGVYNKMHLFSMEELYEPDFFLRGGPDFTVYDLGICKIGMMICYDLRFPELSRKLMLNGADLLVAISAWPKKRMLQFRTVAASRAIENQLFVFVVNRTGIDNQIELGGNTTLYNPLGEPVCGSTDNDTEQVIVAEIDLDEISNNRRILKCLNDRLPNYGI
ncbi:MAG: 2-oxoglutaramate amidase [Pelotomaculum sp. PtaB.Bin104]|nr:MAG: 2-oxoglutaramate amidase [Pelotomaculum sp. PtaB.Bin104]